MAYYLPYVLRRRHVGRYHRSFICIGSSDLQNANLQCQRRTIFRPRDAPKPTGSTICRASHRSGGKPLRSFIQSRTGVSAIRHPASHGASGLSDDSAKRKPRGGGQAVTAKVLSNIKAQFEEVTGIVPSPGPATDIYSSAGNLASDEIKGQSATSLANDLVGTFGSNGSLSQSDVSQALGISPTAPPLMLKVISNNWNSLAGGPQSMATAQLSAAIQKYVLGGAAVGSGAS